MPKFEEHTTLRPASATSQLYAITSQQHAHDQCQCARSDMGPPGEPGIAAPATRSAGRARRRRSPLDSRDWGRGAEPPDPLRVSHYFAWSHRGP